MTLLNNANNNPSTIEEIVSDTYNTIAIIPAYNESDNIVNLLKQVKNHVTSVIVVDDGSTDDTYAKALTTGVRVIKNNRNRGKGAALKRGFIECIRYNPDIIITLDADGQHNPDDIPKLLNPIKEGTADMVIGSRYNTDSMHELPVVRGLGLSLINFLNKSLMKINVKDTQSGFRAYNKMVLGIISDYDCVGYGAETEQLAQADSYDLNIMEVPITIKYKGLGRTSKKNSVSHGTHIVSTILKILIEKRPLLFFGLGGIMIILIALLPLANLLSIFNETRYFSIPLAMIVLGLTFIGSMLILISFVLYALKRIRISINTKKNMMEHKFR